MRKQIMALILAAATVSTMFVAGGCAGKTNATTNNGPAKEVKYWYMWSGDEGKTHEEVVDAFNKSQKQYHVTGLSVPDEQKIITAISSGNGPDVTDAYGNQIAAYQAKGIMTQLDSYIKNTNYSLKDFVPSCLEGCKINGKMYAMPTGAGGPMMLFYNKALLKAAGYDSYPKTDKEMVEMADKTTKVDASGNMTVMGFPDFPFVYYVENVAMSLGANFMSKDGKSLTPDDPQIVHTLQMIADYRKKWGVDKINKFQSSNGAYVSANDIFITGKQALRIDGMWLAADIKKYNSSLEYGIAPLPYPDGHPELEYGGETSVSIFYIPSSSKEKDGAWAFLGYLDGPSGMKTLCEKNKFIPARKALWTDSEISNLDGFKEFTNALDKGKKLRVFPAFSNQDQFTTTASTYYEKVANGQMTPEAAMKELKDKTKDLLTAG